jgi:antitoxin component YwqK of YwqJK toxin-antitoxin module
LDGIYEEWFENGEIAKRCHYINGILTGNLAVFNDNNKLILSEHYNNGTLNGHSYKLIKGLIKGLTYGFTPLLDGVQLKEDSLIELSQYYLGGALHGLTTIRVNSFIRRTILYFNGLKHGGQIDYNLDGTKNKTIYYVKNKSKIIIKN